MFFVTFGQTQGEHTFDEGITEDGVLTWQSQPQQSLVERRIQQWIHHDEFVNNIYLFLRTSEERKKYAYLGRLKYLQHDHDRERPVYFQWQILDWSLSANKQTLLSLELQRSAIETRESVKPTESATAATGLIEVQAPPKAKHSGQSTPQFKGKKNADYSVKDAHDQKLGNAGELAVIAEERKQLNNIGRGDLADRIVHISEAEGDGAGYDIKSFSPDGTVKYIEVKTTRGGMSTPFFMSINEIRFSELHSEHYVLYRLFEFKIDSGSAKLFKVGGNIRNACQFEAINFRVRI